jgi:hypothetical protein
MTWQRKEVDTDRDIPNLLRTFIRNCLNILLSFLPSQRSLLTEISPISGRTFIGSYLNIILFIVTILKEEVTN